MKYERNKFFKISELILVGFLLGDLDRALKQKRAKGTAIEEMVMFFLFVSIFDNQLINSLCIVSHVCCNCYHQLNF